ncbi:MAG: hypothetical protein NVS1B3_16640 [Candidatus Dormibacteraceae bacterium]
MPELEHQLTAVGAQVDWPPTPDLVAGVRNRIMSPARRTPWYQGGLALAAVAVIIALAALAAYPPSRDAIASWVNVHVFFQRVQTVPTPSPLPPGPLGKRLGLGTQTTLTETQKQVTWHVMVPSRLGDPDEVYLQLPPDGPAKGEVTLVYATRPGLPVAAETGVAVLVTEARGAVDAAYFGKVLGPDATMQEATVAGHHGYWIAGTPHAFFFIDASGAVRNETLRLATNTLLLDVNGTIVRIEGTLTRAQALEIAASLN